MLGFCQRGHCSVCDALRIFVGLAVVIFFLTVYVLSVVP